MLSSKSILHVTNNHYTAQRVTESRIPGITLPWQDVLYEGPALGGLSLDEFSKARASYFAQLGWGEYRAILSRFDERNHQMKLSSRHDSIVLWFDRDVYSQLQMIQVLSWIVNRDMRNSYVYLIDIDQAPQGNRYQYLSQLETEKLVYLFESRNEVTVSQLDSAILTWDAFTCGDPRQMVKLLEHDLSSLPKLRRAISWVLQQLPSSQNGLSQIQRLILEAVAQKARSVGEVLQWVKSQDPEFYVVEALFRVYVQSMVDCPYPPLELEKRTDAPLGALADNDFILSLTTLGKQLLRDEQDMIQLNGVNRWVGGLHLVKHNIWRYNPKNGVVAQTYL